MLLEPKLPAVAAVSINTPQESEHLQPARFPFNLAALKDAEEKRCCNKHMILQVRPCLHGQPRTHPSDDVKEPRGPQLLHRHRLGVAGFYSNYCPSQDLAASSPAY